MFVCVCVGGGGGAQECVVDKDVHGGGGLRRNGW